MKAKMDMLEAQKAERERWDKAFDDMQDNYRGELVRKQQEVIKFNELLADWMKKFMELQSALDVKDKPLPHCYYKQLNSLIMKNLAALKEAQPPVVQRRSTQPTWSI